MIDIDYLDVLVDSYNKRSVLEMWRSRNGLQFLSDKEHITSAQFVTANTRLEEIEKNTRTNDCA